MRNIAIYGQIDEAGKIKRGCLELITLARKLCDGGSVCMVMVSDENSLAVDIAKNYGVDEIIILKGENASKGYPAKAYAKAITKLIDSKGFDVMLFLATPFGRDVAPFVSSISGSPMLSYCLDGNVSSDGCILWSVASFGGNLRSVVTFEGEGCVLASVRAGLFSLPEETNAQSVQITVCEGLLPADNGLISLIEILKKQEIIDLESAEVVVAGGKGAGGEKGFALIKELADVLGGVVGASRQAVDRGWIGHEHLVGVSGKIISPKLYIACGIAGYVQHLTGMRDSGFIVAINTDPRALIYDVADVCVVGDMFEILPPLITEVKKIRG